MDKKSNRRENGQFLPGTSGNPRGGRPPAVQGLREFREKNSLEVMEFLLNFMRDENQPGMARVAAAKELNDRFHGKPMQASVNMDVDGSGEDWGGLSMLLQSAKSALLQRAERTERVRKEAAQAIEPPLEPIEPPRDPC